MAWESNFANRGMDFEEIINFSNIQYQNKGIACMQKVPTAFIPLRNAQGRIYNVKVEEKSTVDYIGHYKGIPVAIEAKQTQKKRISLSRVQPHQAEFLNCWDKDENTMAFVLVNFQNKNTYMIPWACWKEAAHAWNCKKGKCLHKHLEAYGWSWETPGTASLLEEDLKEEWKIPKSNKILLPYLSVIEKSEFYKFIMS